VDLHYDEPRLVSEISRLTNQFRTAFAAASAERLLPAYVRYSEQRGRGDANELASILEQLWGDLGSGTVSADIDAPIANCMALTPREADGPWIDSQAAAEDAGAALAYALRSWKTGDSQEAAWAARRAYEALDDFVINRLGIDVNNPGARDRVRQHPLVQAELARQQRDLAELRDASGQPTASVVSRLRDRAREEARLVFG
jgi:uncharacterized protein YjaG (DUF416 family)